MRTILVIMVIVYVLLTLGGASATLPFTIQIYTLHGRALPDILSAAILNTAAVFAATSFFGVLDMFLTLWTLLKSKDWEEEARKEREADRQAREKEREENRQVRAAEQQAREKEAEENRRARAAEQQAHAAEQQAREADRQLRVAELQAREKELEANRQLREAELQAREREREQARLEREAELQARLQSLEAERLAREQALQENRIFQQRILDELSAERAAQAQMTSRMLDLLEQVTYRLNGSGNGNGNRSE